MRVLHLGTSDSSGGAARAMYRWHSSLRKLDVVSQILCLNKSAEDESVSIVAPNWEESATVECGGLQRYFIESNRTAYSGTYFSHPLGYVSIADHELVRGADVVHVHWTSLLFDWREIRRIKTLGKAVVLTPHDLWPVTGGCHYPKGCEGYLRECLNCPMVHEDPFGLISNSRALKQNVIADAVDVILSPSHWMDEAFRNVENLKSVRRVVIPYCVDVSQLRAKPREYSKQELGFKPERRLVLFCAEYVAEGRKGLDQLIDVLKTCESRQELRRVLEHHTEFALIGKGSDWVEIPTIFGVHRRGYVETTDELCRYYSAADLVIYLGLEDNLPNVVLEAMACGTPSLAFDTGGIGDMIEDGVTGHLVPQKDVTGFAERLAALLSDSRKLSWLGMNARERTLSRFSEEVVGLELRRLYEALGRRPREFARQRLSAFDESPFQDAVQRTIQKAMGKGFRMMEDEIRVLRSQLIELRADLERERQRSLWDRFKERLTRLVFDIVKRS
jgi:glycosyltransferase involved in cell wall biosynthesis